MKWEEKNKRKFFKVRGNIDIVKDLSSGVVYSIIGEKKKTQVERYLNEVWRSKSDQANEKANNNFIVTTCLHTYSHY